MLCCIKVDGLSTFDLVTPRARESDVRQSIQSAVGQRHYVFDVLGLGVAAQIAKRRHSREPTSLRNCDGSSAKQRGWPSFGITPEPVDELVLALTAVHDERVGRGWQHTSAEPTFVAWVNFFQYPRQRTAYVPFVAHFATLTDLARTPTENERRQHKGSWR